jgi:GMP synthase (glutamine-hydrolysing)
VLRLTADGTVIPVHSVGVQGDERSYAPVIAIDSLDHTRATQLINRLREVNRVIAPVALKEPLAGMKVRASGLTRQRIARLREADAIVRGLSHQSGYDHQVWQFPVILIPLGTEESPDAIVLRPIDSVDGMTAQSVTMPPELLDRMCAALMQVGGIAGVFYDLTHKPPGTIEWE